MPSQEKLAEFVARGPNHGTHNETALPKAVVSRFAACGFSPKKDLLAQLLALNLEVAQRIDQAQPVSAPGIPANYPDPRSLVTDDCIQPQK